MRIPIINRFTCLKSQITSTINNLERQNFGVILDYANENFKHLDQNITELNNLIKKFPNNFIALKLSSLNIKNDYRKARDISFSLCETAIQNQSKILVDAEDYKIQNSIESITDELLEEFNKDDVNIYKTYQMYRIDTFDKLKHDMVKQRDYHVGVKLVRGAYYNQDQKYDILFTDIEQTHQSYNQSINLFCDYGAHGDSKDQLIIASHNKDSVLLGMTKNKDNIKYSQLMGMSDDLSKMIADSGNQVYKYLPYGNFMDTLPYLIRRIYENPRMFIYL